MSPDYFIKRMLASLAVLLGVTFVAFLFLHLLPGDPARLLAGPDAPPVQVEKVREKMGLDRPLLVQYGEYLGRLLKGDLGTSLRTGRPVSEEIAARYPLTFVLALGSLVFAVLWGLPCGILAAVQRKNGQIWISLLSVLSFSTPVYWLGFLLILVAAVHYPLFPVGGGSAKAMVLPVLALGIHVGGVVGRMTESAVGEVLHKHFVQVARGKGLPERRVLFVHALKPAALPLFNVVGLQVGALLGGAVITETIFGLNGLGRQLVVAIGFRDYPVIQGILLVMAVNFMAANLLVDLVAPVLDPRLQG